MVPAKYAGEKENNEGREHSVLVLALNRREAQSQTEVYATTTTSAAGAAARVEADPRNVSDRFRQILP